MGETVKKKSPDDDQDDRPYQITPGLDAREKNNGEIHHKKDYADAANNPASPGVMVDQEKPQADGH